MVSEPVDVDKYDERTDEEEDRLAEAREERERYERERHEDDDETSASAGDNGGATASFLTNAAFNVGRAAGAAKRGIDSVGVAISKLGGAKALPSASEEEPASGVDEEPRPEGEDTPVDETETKTADEAVETDASTSEM